MKILKSISWVLVLATLCVNELHSQVDQSGSNIINCGHLFDGPAYYIKQLENKSLDNMFILTQEEKQQIGNANYKQIVKTYKLIEEFQDKKRILQTFSNLKKGSSSTTEFKLHVIASDDINAFTMIGGHIYLTSGLLSYIESMDELAFILGHEMGHHEKFHLERKIKKIVATSKFFSKTGVEDFTKIAIDFNNKFSSPFDQINEYEADEYGFDLARNAGYDISRFADFFKRLEKSEKKSMLAKLNSTHPFSSDRRKCLENYIAN